MACKITGAFHDVECNEPVRVWATSGRARDRAILRPTSDRWANLF